MMQFAITAKPKPVPKKRTLQAQPHVSLPSEVRSLAGMPLFLQRSPIDSALPAPENASDESPSELPDESDSFAADTKASAQASSQSEVKVVNHTTWTVQGKDPINVSLSLENHAQQTSGEAAHILLLANTLAKLMTEKETNPNGTLKRVVLLFPLEQELPEWPEATGDQVPKNDQGQPCPCWKQEWNRLRNALASHEQKHVNIYKKRLEGIHRQLIGKTEADAETLVTHAIEQAEQDQDAFDLKTKHGINDHPSTNYDAGKPCQC